MTLPTEAGTRPEPRSTFEDRYSTAGLTLVPWLLESLDLDHVKDVADLGCGDGRLSLPLARALTVPGAQLHAVDRDPRWTARVASWANELPIRAQVGDVVDADLFSDGSLDLVTASLVLHLVHRREVDRVFDNVRRWLRPSGRFVVAAYGEHHQIESLTWLRDALVLLDVPRVEADEVARRCHRRQIGSVGFYHQRALEVFGPHYDQVTFRRFEDRLRVRVSTMGDILGERFWGDPRVRDVLGARVASLGRALRDVLDAASVDGHVFLTADVAAVTAAGPRATRLREPHWMVPPARPRTAPDRQLPDRRLPGPGPHPTQARRAPAHD
jgi:SAM-dependent methyltransferase